MGSHRFEFRASLSDLGEGLDVLHQSVERLRRAAGRNADDLAVILFETALAEIGGNVLTHGRPRGPSLEREDGRGLAIARSLLDELGYERDGDLNRWRLVKRL